MGFHFPGRARLDARGVKAVLESGFRLRGKSATPWLVRVLPARAEGDAKLAISIPKRWIKSSVARNRLKRQAREAFRQHGIRLQPVDLLVSVNGACKTGDVPARKLLRQALAQLLDQAAARSVTVAA